MLMLMLITTIAKEDEDLAAIGGVQVQKATAAEAGAEASRAPPGVTLRPRPFLRTKEAEPATILVRDLALVHNLALVQGQGLVPDLVRDHPHRPT
mmetsp:Transcript_12809/g.26976  ORF Transcript_12809/g.26976 Transcript_12809/m.26976 type:complete len:95 (+) Transcript_12809:753-1037(+)